MHTIIRPIQIATTLPAERHDAFRTPHCDMVERNGRVEATVYLPGIEARGVELLLAKGELVLTARKPMPVRTNWIALSLERRSHNYRLRFRTKRLLLAAQVRAEFDEGVLQITIERSATSQKRAA